jgi:hypothetical protein
MSRYFSSSLGSLLSRVTGYVICVQQRPRTRLRTSPPTRKHSMRRWCFTVRGLICNGYPIPDCCSPARVCSSSADRGTRSRLTLICSKRPLSLDTHRAGSAAPLCRHRSSNRSRTFDDWYQPLRHFTIHDVIIHQPKDSIWHIAVSREQNDR